MEAATNIIQIPQENQFKVVKFELTPEAITEMVKEYESLELIPGDKESYKTIHEAKMICVKARTGTNKHRKELGADARKWISDVNQAAQELIAPLLPLEEKLKAMLEEEDNREAKIAQEKADKIAGLMSDLEHHIKRGQTYNLSAETIKKCLDVLEAFEISAVDFDTETERAEALKTEGLETLGRILADRERWEADQAEAARIKAENDAKEKALAEERAKFEAQQEAARAEQKKKDDAAALIATQEAEKLREREAQLEADRQDLERQKAENKAREEADNLRKYLSDWYDAILINQTMIPDAALEMDAQFNAGWERAKEINKAIEKEKKQADKDRAKLVAADKRRIQAIVNDIDKFISESVIFQGRTDEGTMVISDLYISLKKALSDAETAGVELV